MTKDADLPPEHPAALNARDDHGCFGCGRLNPHSLRLRFYPLADGDGVWAPFTPAPVHEGYAGIVHGGIITTVLDEVMAWSLYTREVWAMTARMSVTFRQPVVTGVPARAIGWLVSDRGRLLDVAAELRRDADDVLLAEATGTFARVPEAQARAWEARYLADPSAEPNR